MICLSNESKKWFMQFYFGIVSPKNFSEWLFKDTEIEKEIGKSAYFELIEKNYDDHLAVINTRKIVLRIYIASDADLKRDYAIYALQQMLNNKLALAQGCKILADLNADGCSFIPIVFVGYSSELDTPEKGKHYHDRILKDSRDLLNTLEQ